MSNQTPLLKEQKSPSSEQGATRTLDPQETGPIDQAPVENQRAQYPERQDVPIIVIEEEHQREEHEHEKFSEEGVFVNNPYCLGSPPLHTMDFLLYYSKTPT